MRPHPRSLLLLSSLTLALLWAVPRDVARAADQPTLGLRYPSLAPDNASVAFAWRGDLWIAPADGKGPAKRLTIHEAQETLPRVSPDGKQVAFSSRRNGGYDLFVTSVEGGLPKQVTFHGGPAVLCNWSPDGKRLLFQGARGPRMTGMDLWEVDVGGGTPRAITLDGGKEGSYHPNGKTVVYARGFNTVYHDNYEGSAGHDLYVVDEPGALPRRLTDAPGNERWPFFSADGKTVYFVTEEKGVANFYAMPAAGGKRRQVTSFEEDVWRPLPGWDRKTVVFEQVGKVHTADLTAEKPQARLLPIVVKSDVRHSGVEIRTITNGPEQVDVSPDGTRLAFTVHGDLWTMPASGGQGTRLTSAKENDQWPRFSPDGRKIAYQREKDGSSDLHLLDLKTKKSRQLTRHKANDFFHAWSPDGQKLVFTSERSGNKDLWTLEVESGQLQQLTRHPAADDDPVFSPDGRWLAFDSGREGNQAIFVMPSEGGPARRLSQGNGFFQVPSFSPDGSMIVFEQVNEATGDSAGLHVISSRGGPATPLTRDGTTPRWSPRGDYVFYVLSRRGQTEIYRHPAPRSLDQAERIPFTGRIEVDLKSELADLFDEAWKLLKDGFYDENMHGVDWDEMRKKYRPLAIEAEVKSEFQNVIRQMLAELGASHLGISGGDPTDNIVRPKLVETGLLGLELEPKPANGGGLKVVSVLAGGPADRTGIRVGDVITVVHKTRIKPVTNLDKVLSDTAEKEIRISFRPVTADGLGEERRETITPFTWRQMYDQLYKNWVARRAKTVKNRTKGQVGYVHLSRMDGGNLRRFTSAVNAWNRNAKIKGMVLDVRNNGGGNIHVPLMQILTSRPFMRLQTRGRPKTTQPSPYWDKPVVVLINERSFSDAEVFPYAFRSSKRGQVVGVPTPGGVIGTNDVTLSDGSRFRIPRVGWWGMDGTRLEGVGAKPDILVIEAPDDRRRGKDPQLLEAVKVVMGEVREAERAAQKTKKPTTEKPEKKPATEQPRPGKERAPPSERGTAKNPLADSTEGEWTRYRVAFGGSESVVRLEVRRVTDEQVLFSKVVESGGAFLPGLPDEATRGPILENLGHLGEVKRSEEVEQEIRGVRTQVLRVTVDWSGTPVVLSFTNRIPALGLWKAEVGGETVLTAVDWSDASTAPASPAGDVPEKAPEKAPEKTPEKAPEEKTPPSDEAKPSPGPDAPIENPLYDAEVGEWVRFRQVLPQGEALLTHEVVEVTDDEVAIATTVLMGERRAEGPTLRRPRRRTFERRSRGPTSYDRETVTVDGRELACVVVTAEGRRGSVVRRWFCPEIPVSGLVRQERGGTLVRELVAWGTDGNPPEG